MAEPVFYTIRLKFPANYEIPAHWHPVVERVTVLSGTFHMGVGDKLDRSKTMAVTPGGRDDPAGEDPSLRLERGRGDRPA
jgi:anti-sigma factor ChrR (cupin superfamily)